MKNSKFAPLLAAFVSLPLLLCPLPALADGQSGLTGNWARDDGTVRMRIGPCGADLCAVNTWVKASDSKERVGDKLILMLAPISPSEFQGQAHDVRRQMTYKITLALQGSGLSTTACVLYGIICKSVGWTRDSD